MRGLDLEFLRTALGDNRTHITLAVIKKVEVLLDLSGARAECSTLPEELEVVADIAWGACSQGGGTFLAPSVGDLVLLAFDELATPYVVARLSSKDDKLPLAVRDGHLVIKAPAGKKAFLASDTKVLLGKGGLLDAAEPVPLGNVLAECLNALFTKFDAVLTKLIAGPIGMGNLGAPVATYPQLILDLTPIQVELATLKTQYLSAPATSILSQTVFTER